MKFKIKLAPIFLSLFILSTATACSNATPTQSTAYTVTQEGVDFKLSNAPETPAWFPDQLLNLNMDELNVDINKSNIPLATRVDMDKITTVNPNQNTNTKVVAISIMNRNTSGNVPHGTNNFWANTFSYWQYIDKMVYWGGSSGEGIIVPPTPDVVDSAHKNGVPVLGTIFFPPAEFGGKVQWVDDFLTKDENGNFPIIDKLITVAKEYGFDGWFVNQETNVVSEEDLKDKNSLQTTEKYAKLFMEFLQQFNKKAENQVEIMWYDAMTKDGVVDWQNQLNDLNKDFVIDADKNQTATMFLNFWWNTEKLKDQKLLEASKNYAQSIGYDPKNLFAGIDVQQDGTLTPVFWDLLENGANDTQTSIGLYCPSWTFFSAGEDFDMFQDKEGSLWVNEFKDPSLTTKSTGRDWRGISNYVAERTVVNSLPFKTNFNMGNGYNYFINGEKVSSLDWNNRSLAGIMPTYRWIIENGEGNSVTPSIDYSNAYYGGNSIKFLANLKANTPSYVKLFSSSLTIEENTKFKIKATADSPVSLNLKLQLADGSEEIIKASKELSDKWEEITFDISSLANKEVSAISFEMVSSEEKIVAINLGEIYVGNDESYDKIDVTSAKIDDFMFEEDDTIAGINISYDASTKENLKAFEIYKKNADGSYSFLGANLNSKFYINSLQREGDELNTDFYVVAVNENDERGNSAKVTISWPDNTVPKADFKASKTLVAPNEEITLTNLSNALSTDFEWTLEGANVATSTDKEPTIKYEKEGTYTIKLKAKNEKGEDEIVKESLIEVSNSAKDIKNLALNQKTEASSFVNPNEAPEFAVDGDVTKKWCAVGKENHNITIDLGGVHKISQVVVQHAQAGGESPDMNTKEYKIEVSQDGKNFTEVVYVKNNSLATTVDTFAPIDAQYVKFTSLKATQGSDTATRIYEIEVNGI